MVSRRAQRFPRWLFIFAAIGCFLLVSLLHHIHLPEANIHPPSYSFLLPVHSPKMQVHFTSPGTRPSATTRGHFEEVSHLLASYTPHTQRLLTEVLNRTGNRSSPYLVVRTEGGLSNRMRALASAAAFAATTNRKLIAVWVPDPHCRAFFHDLFAPDDELHIINEPINVRLFRPKVAAHSNDSTALPSPGSHWYIRDLLREAVERGRHLHDAESDPPVRPRSSASNVYLRTNMELSPTDPPVLPSELRRAWTRFRNTSATVQVLLHAHTPVESKRRLAKRGELGLVSGDDVRPELSERIGVHIRSLGNLTLDVPGIATGNSGTAGAAPWPSFDSLSLGVDAMRHYAVQRRLCSPAVFIEAMKAEIRRDPARARFYVAADSVATIVAVEDAMAKFLENEGVGKTGKAGALRAAGGKLQPPVTLHLSEALLTQCDGSQRRGMACQQIALADQLLLSRTRKILRSSASSFSDAAIALHNCAPVSAPKYLGHPEPPTTTSSSFEELPKEMEVLSPCT